jgi:chemotaxis protein methyltransferase CheR
MNMPLDLNIENPNMDSPLISDREFSLFQRFMYETVGIMLTPVKKVLVAARLNKRLRYYHLKSYSEYFDFAVNGANPNELQMMIDLLTTNETYFFREPEHFDILKNQILTKWKGQSPFRAWSAACSSGEEPYSIAMVLMDFFGEQIEWEVFGSDISRRVLSVAEDAHYTLLEGKSPPKYYLTKYCLKGVRSQEGTFLIDKKIRNHVKFEQINLNTPFPNLGLFDVIFLRNVLIYFDVETKRRLVHRLLPTLKSGGHCFFGHAESLVGIMDDYIHNQLNPVAPTVYCKR